MAGSIANEKHTVVRGLGEIALRVNNLDAMQTLRKSIEQGPKRARCHRFKVVLKRFPLLLLVGTLRGSIVELVGSRKPELCARSRVNGEGNRIRVLTAAYSDVAVSDGA
jgi:hypothetical protein